MQKQFKNIVVVIIDIMVITIINILEWLIQYSFKACFDLRLIFVILHEIASWAHKYFIFKKR